jgi:starvation-inducible DNA-binding protein
MKMRKQSSLHNAESGVNRSQPALHQRARETQPFDSVIAELPLGLTVETREEMVHLLNQILADTMTLRDLYKKSHWQVSGPTFYQLHLLFDKHYTEQIELVDEIAERIQVLGGIAIAMAHDVAELTLIARPPRGREEVPVQISRLLEAHETIIKEVRTSARESAELEDDGTNDLLVSEVLRTNEFQVWFLSEHLVKMPLVIAK